MNFLRCFALQEKWNWLQLASRCCWNRTHLWHTCFLPGRTKDLSAPRYMYHRFRSSEVLGSAHRVQVCAFVWIWEQGAFVTHCSINWLVCITLECLLVGTDWDFNCRLVHKLPFVTTRILLSCPLAWKKPLRRPRRRWEDNIKMNLQEVRLEVAWTGLIWLRIGTGGELLQTW